MGGKKFYLTPVLPFAVLLLLAASALGASFLLPAGSEYLSLTILLLCCMALPAAFHCKFTGGWTLERMRVRLIDFSGVLFSLVATVVLICLSTLLRLGLEHYTTASAAERLYGFVLPQTQGNIASVLFRVVVLAILPTILEEFVFHCVIETELEQNFGAVAAILLSSFYYALTALSVYEFPVSFLVGLLTGVIFCITRSVLASGIMHFCYCLYALFLKPYIWEFVAKPDNTTFFVFLAGSLLLLFLILTFGEAERLFYRRAIDNAPSPAAQPGFLRMLRNTAALLISPGTLLCILLFVLYVLFR